MKQQFENVFSFLDEIGKEIDKKARQFFGIAARRRRYESKGMVKKFGRTRYGC